jgi:hypothetical protein
MRISRFEKITLIVLMIALWAVLALYAGAPIFSDEFMYIDIGLRNYKEPSYGNRYFHIYLEKLFMNLASTPLQGVRIFWGFIIALTVGLIYYNARTFLRGSHPLHGLLAVAFFFTFPLMTEYSGEPAVDLTAMLMVTVYFSVYLFGLRNPDKRKLALVLLGMLAFLAFKTKETTVFVNLMLLGFALDEENHWQWRKVLAMIKPLLLGLAAGILIFMLLDGLILGDPFFAISPSTFGAIFTHYDFGRVFFTPPSSWYREYFLDDLLLPFLLFVVGGLRLRDELDVPHKLVWMYPLLMAVFVTLNMIKIPWGFIERFYFPALPMLAVLAPQFLRFEWPENKRSWLGFGLLLALAGGLLFGLRSLLLDYAAFMSFDYAELLDSLYYPVILSLLLGSVIWAKRFKWFSVVLPLFCIAAMLLSPLLYTYKYFYRYPKINERYADLMYPFRTFQEELALQPDDRLYISPRMDLDYGMLSDDPNDIVAMYNFYYDARVSTANVFMGYTRDALFKQLTIKEQSHALLTQADWEWLQASADDFAVIEGMYEMIPDPQGRLVLLVHK